MVGYTHVEVRKVPGKWRVTLYGKNGATRVENVLAFTRLKRSAFLIGTGAAKALEVELRVTDRKGRYTDEAASYGNDPESTSG
jgi:hypothetical protein